MSLLNAHGGFTEHVATAVAGQGWLAGQPSLVGYETETEEEITLPV